MGSLFAAVRRLPIWNVHIAHANHLPGRLVVPSRLWCPRALRPGLLWHLYRHDCVDVHWHVLVRLLVQLWVDHPDPESVQHPGHLLPCRLPRAAALPHREAPHAVILRIHSDSSSLPSIPGQFLQRRYQPHPLHCGVWAEDCSASLQCHTSTASAAASPCRATTASQTTRAGRRRHAWQATTGWEGTRSPYCAASCPPGYFCPPGTSSPFVCGGCVPAEITTPW